MLSLETSVRVSATWGTHSDGNLGRFLPTAPVEGRTTHGRAAMRLAVTPSPSRNLDVSLTAGLGPLRLVTFAACVQRRGRRPTLPASTAFP